MSSDRLNVRVVSNQNSVELTKNENTVVISDKNRDTSVNVTQKETTVVTVVSKGPKGNTGDKGDTGIAVTNQIATGSITASVDIGTDTFKVQSGSSTFLFVSSSGNVGIGTTTPQSQLHITGANALFTLSPLHPLPTSNVPSASFATSGSGANLKPYFWNGSSWNALY